MTIDEAIEILSDVGDINRCCSDDAEALDMAIKALEQCEVWNGSHGQIVAPKGTFKRIYDDGKQQPCDDCVSREALRNLKISVPIAPVFTDDNYIKYRDAVFYDDIIDLPPVTPQPKIGRWLHPYKSDVACECSICHRQMPIGYDYHFCPVCGADLRGGDTNDS